MIRVTIITKIVNKDNKFTIFVMKFKLKEFVKFIEE